MTEPSEDRRRFQRVATDKAVELQFGDRTLPGIVRDISLRGLLLELSRDLPPDLEIGSTVSARVTLDGDDWQIASEGSVAHLADRQIGMLCRRMDVESASRLRRLVELNLGAPELLERELAELVQD